MLELLAAVCLVRGGHDIILAAFDNFKEVGQIPNARTHAHTHTHFRSRDRDMQYYLCMCVCVYLLRDDFPDISLWKGGSL